MLFPYVRRDSLQYRAWNDYLKSEKTHLPVIWDSETGEITQLKKPKCVFVAVLKYMKKHNVLVQVVLIVATHNV